jgi:hypothetical protein
MRLAPLILPLLLCGCGSRGGDSAEGEGGGGPAGDPLANLAAPLPDDQAARIEALISQAIPGVLQNAKDAQYRNVRAGVGGAACGEVAPKPAKGKPLVFLPFVVTADSVALVAASPRIAFEDPADMMADAWVRWCATPEELERIRPQLQQAARSSANEVSAVEAPPFDPSIPDVPVLPPPTIDKSPAPAAKAPPPAPPAPPPQIDSFFNSVQRRDR